MFLKLKNPLVIFDLETTGISITRDRIVELSMHKVNPDGTIDKKYHRLNPEMPIPAETSVIHGIYDEDVKDAPTFKDVARNLESFLKGADLAGFNILKFDVPMLVEEFLRVNINFDVSNKKLIDAQKIFHAMEKRTLAAAFEFYCGKKLEDAHSAEADTQATLEVLDAMVKKYEGKKVMTPLGKEVGTIENDTENLHRLFSGDIVDLAGRLKFNDKKEIVFNFGKHRGKLVEKVLQQDSSYYDWMMNGDFPNDTKRRLTEIRLKMLAN